MFKRLKERLAAHLGPILQEQALRAMETRSSEVVIVRRAAQDGDALPGRGTPITYELSLEKLGRMSWNPDVALEPTNVLESSDAGEPITQKLLREAIIRGAIQESRAGVEGYEPKANLADGKITMRHEPVAPVRKR